LAQISRPTFAGCRLRRRPIWSVLAIFSNAFHSAATRSRGLEPPSGLRPVQRTGSSKSRPRPPGTRLCAYGRRPSRRSQSSPGGRPQEEIGADDRVSVAHPPGAAKHLSLDEIEAGADGLRNLLLHRLVRRRTEHMNMNVCSRRKLADARRQLDGRTPRRPPAILLCPLYVDSRRRLGANSILGGGRIALMAARAHERRCAFRAVPPGRIQGWPPAPSLLV
jgi:hypothetical protein